MAVTLSSDFVKTQKMWIKKAMKGRPVHFGIQAQGAKKGKFFVSRKPGDCKPKAIKELKPYEETGKDAKQAAAMNEIKAAPSQGVCKGAGGTLTLYVEKGPEKPAFEKFVKFFVTRQMKIKLVKQVEIAEVAAGQLPAVPDKDPSDDEKPTLKSVQERAKDLLARSKKAGADAFGVVDRVKAALEFAKKDPEGADERLDEIESAIDVEEWAKQQNNAEILGRVEARLKEWDIDGAEEVRDAAEPEEEAEEAESEQEEQPGGQEDQMAAVPADGKFAELWPAARTTWMSASEAVDRQISALQAAMRSHDDEQIQEIAQFGLNGVTGAFKVKLMAAMSDLDQAADAASRKAAAAKTQTIVNDMAAHIMKDDRVEVCDGNPFGVPVSIRETLKPAFVELGKALKAATG